MIVDTTTGEVLNPPIVRGRFTVRHSYNYSHQYNHTHQHTHQHNHVHSYVHSYRSNFSAARKNSITIFTIFVLMLLFMNYFSAMNGSSREFTFYSVLQYFSNTDNFIDLSFFDDISTFLTNNANYVKELLSYRVDSESVFSFINIFLNIFDTIYNLIIGFGQVLYFMGECCMTLMTFILSIVGFIFG